jgi:hypothetical protein
MQDFVTNLKSTSWWIGVVVVGILINIVSAYFKGRLDSTFSRFSSGWKQRSAARTETRNQKVAYLIANPSEQVFLGMQELRVRAQSIYSSVLAVVSIVTGFFALSEIRLGQVFAVILLTLGLILFLISLSFDREATTLSSLLNEARKSKYNDY